MLINNKHYRAIWEKDKFGDIEIIDQTLLPHKFKTITIKSLKKTFE